MKRSWCWRSLRGGLRGGLQAAALVSLLAGCSVTDMIFGGGSGSSAITSWVAAHFTAQTVGGTTVYNLTKPS